MSSSCSASVSPAPPSSDSNSDPRLAGLRFLSVGLAPTCCGGGEAIPGSCCHVRTVVSQRRCFLMQNST